jgi:hypothetical protein
MCAVRPRLTNPWQLLQIANVALAPWLPLTVTSSEVKNMQVGGQAHMCACVCALTFLCGDDLQKAERTGPPGAQCADVDDVITG